MLFDEDEYAVENHYDWFDVDQEVELKEDYEWEEVDYE